MSGSNNLLHCIVEDELPKLDVNSSEYRTNPSAVLAAARAQGELAVSARGIEVLSYEMCNEIFGETRFRTLGVAHFAKMSAPASMLSFVEHGLLLNMPPDPHDRIRKVLLRAFTMRRIDAERGVMRTVTDQLIDSFLDRGSCDFVAEFTEQLPVQVLCLLLGIPVEDIPLFHRAAVDLHLMGAVPLAPGFPRIDEALRNVYDYVQNLVAERRQRPQEDFVSALVRAQAAESGLSDEELIWNIVNLLFAGQDTTRYQLASVIRALLDMPDLWDALAGGNGALASRVLEEGLRYLPVTQFLARLSEEDIELAGFVFPAGRRVILNLLAASRDPSVFAAPDRFDLDRSPTYKLPFGRGIHHCLGAALARAEMTEALLRLSARLHHLELAADIQLAPATAMIGGPESLPITFAAR